MAITKREKRVKGQGGGSELPMVVIAAVILGLLVYFAFPYITGALPKKRAVNALKNAGVRFENAADNLIDILSEKVTGENVEQFKGTIKLNNRSVSNKNLLTYLQTDTIYYDIQTDWEKMEVRGEINWSTGGERFFKIHFYTDGFYLCFQVPELSEEIFKLDWGSNLSAEVRQNIEKIFEIVIGLNQEGPEQYYDKIKEAVEKGVSAFSRLVEKCSYSRLGTDMVYTDNQSVEAEMFEVTVPLAVLAEEFHLTVKEDIHFKLYIKEEKVVGLNLDLSQFSQKVSGNVFLSCLGEKFFDDICLEISININKKRCRVNIYSNSVFITINETELKYQKLDSDRHTFSLNQQTGFQDFFIISSYIKPDDGFIQWEELQVSGTPKQGGSLDALLKWFLQVCPQGS